MHIGVFDSGLGGLTIFKELLLKLPQYNYMYFGDNARVPYGGRSDKLIYEYTKKAVDFLFNRNCLIVILACNSASAVALKKLQHEYLPKYYPNRKILGVIKPAVEIMVEKKFTKVGLIATYATVQSHSFVREFAKLSPKMQIYQNTSPLLVPIIEEGELDWVGLKLILNQYFKPLTKEKIEALILGCTHYGIIYDLIQKEVGDKIYVLSEGWAVAKKFDLYLQNHQDLKRKLSHKKLRKYFVTDLNPRYEHMAQVFMGKHFQNHHRLILVNI
jgi:glutamate racemase